MQDSAQKEIRTPQAFSGASLSQKKGVLFVNVGTPDRPDEEAVKVYLEEFLMDPDVIDIPTPLRWLLVHGIILRTRPKASAEAYQQVWTKEGSPLLVNLNKLTEKVEKKFSSNEFYQKGLFSVKGAMRLGSPSLSEAFEEFEKEGVFDLLIVPLFPQYAEATTGSVVKEVHRLNAKRSKPFRLEILDPFFEHPQFIAAWGQELRAVLQESAPDHVLMSFHGLPERQIVKKNSECKGCLKLSQCESHLSDSQKQTCYRYQSYQTAKRIAEAVDLSEGQFSVSFQSRLGRDKWLSPSTEETLKQLAESGVKKLAVVCPAFVADCLETLEEIGMRGRELFLKHGGQDYVLVSCLNDSEIWVDTVCRMVVSRIANS